MEPWGSQWFARGSSTGGRGQKSEVLGQKGANRAREAWRFAQKVSKESTKGSSPGG